MSANVGSYQGYRFLSLYFELRGNSNDECQTLRWPEVKWNRGEGNTVAPSRVPRRYRPRECSGHPSGFLRFRLRNVVL